MEILTLAIPLFIAHVGRIRVRVHALDLQGVENDLLGHLALPSVVRCPLSANKASIKAYRLVRSVEQGGA